MKNLDDMYKKGVDALWRDLCELDALISECLEGESYRWNLEKYLHESLLVVAFLKQKPRYKKRRFLDNMKHALDHCRENGYTDMEEHYAREIIFFEKEFIDEQYRNSD